MDSGSLKASILYDMKTEVSLGVTANLKAFDRPQRDN